MPQLSSVDSSSAGHVEFPIGFETRSDSQSVPDIVIGPSGPHRAGEGADVVSASTPRRRTTSESSLSVSLAGGALLVIAFLGIVAWAVPPTTWAHDFFFRRSFVQWVLLMAFATGLLQLAQRVPGWLRERRALDELRSRGIVSTAGTMVGRRWTEVAVCRDPGGHRDHAYYRTLADHDEAEIEAAYRVSGDIVQVLPLIGFFGTVFGLSSGLYQSFLTSGGASPKDFASAIAIAFDNTLLGLALTILLFIGQSVLRKRDDAALLELNRWISPATFPTRVDTPSEALAGLADAMTGYQAALDRHRMELQALQSALQTADGTLRDVVLALQLPAGGIRALVTEQTAQVTSSVVEGVQATTAALEADMESRLTGLADTLRDRDRQIADSVALVQAAIVTNAATLEDRVSSLASGQEQIALRQSSFVGDLRELVASQTDDIKREVRLPRTIRFVEERQAASGDGVVS